MTKAVFTYKPIADVKSGKGLRLYMRDGIVMNPAVDAKIVEGVQAGELTAVCLRYSGKGRRSLLVDVPEELT